MHASLLALLALASPALAQTAPTDTTHFYKHHLGLTASPQLDHFFTANRSLPVGLLYKYQNKTHALWRFGLTLNQDYSRQDENNPYYTPSLYLTTKSNPEYVNNNFGLGLSIGREYTHRFAKRWVGTVGLDLLLGFSQEKSVRVSQRVGDPAQNIPSTEVKDGYRLRSYQVALLPFAGLRFEIWPRLYVSAESTIQLGYLRQTTNTLGLITEINSGRTLAGMDDFTDQQIINQSAISRYRLINQMSVHYQLGKQ